MKNLLNKEMFILEDVYKPVFRFYGDIPLNLWISAFIISIICISIPLGGNWGLSDHGMVKKVIFMVCRYSHLNIEMALFYNISIDLVVYVVFYLILILVAKISAIKWGRIGLYLVFYSSNSFLLGVLFCLETIICVKEHSL